MVFGRRVVCSSQSTAAMRGSRPSDGSDVQSNNVFVADLLRAELFNLLINPAEHDFALRWHRDDVRETATAEEEVEALGKWHHGVGTRLLLSLALLIAIHRFSGTRMASCDFRVNLTFRS